MKSFFKYISWISLLLISAQCFANSNNIIVITYDKNLQFAERARAALIKQTSIPLNLIFIRWQANPCKANHDIILQICVSDNGEMDFPVIKKKILNNAFKVFKRNTKELI